MSDTVNGADVLARIKPKLREESTQLCMSNDLLDEWAALQDQLVESQAQDMAGQRLADGKSKRTKDLAVKLSELEEQIEEQSMVVRFRAMNKDTWQGLCANHPPRKGDQVDAYTGYNRDAVLNAAVRECMISPVFVDCVDDNGDPNLECDHTDCGTWQQFVAVCNPNEWIELRDTVNSVNRGVVEPPKSELASRILARRATG